MSTAQNDVPSVTQDMMLFADALTCISIVFQAGEGATSKSFCFNIMTEMSIPGTIEVISPTKLVKVTLLTETEMILSQKATKPHQGCFDPQNPNADSSQEAMSANEKLTFKELMQNISPDEATGKRGSRVTKSECIGVWMEPNDPPSEVEEALETRFWGNFEQQNRIGRDIDDCMNGERMMSLEDKIYREHMNQEAREEQFRVTTRKLYGQKSSKM